MKNLFQVLLSSIKAKITPIWTKIKLFTNWNFLKTRVFTKIRQLFTNLFSIKPKTKNDYYTIGRWMIGKKLCLSIAIVLGLLGLYYLIFVNPPSFLISTTDGIKTYKYNSIPLRFASGKVRIKAQSGYIAYEGDVDSGKVTGKGTLTNSEGTTVYTGDFLDNKYNGTGILYYENGQLHYKGEFKDNIFNGVGSQYRENAIIEYEGDFVNGLRDGSGILYDSTGTQVYTGHFSKNELVYQDLLGINTGDVFKSYTGSRDVYLNDDYFVTHLKDIDAAFYGRLDSNTLSGEIPVEGIYVLKGSLNYNGKEYKNVYEAQEVFGTPEYEGNSYILLPEAVVIHLMNKQGFTFYGEPGGEYDYAFDDVIRVNSFDDDYAIYLYTYVNSGIRYSFFCNDRSGDFYAYLIEKE